MTSQSGLRDQLETSLARQKRLSRSTLVLNPVENFPFASDIRPGTSFLHGLYNTDKVRTPEQQRESVHQFAGRARVAYDMRRIYHAWADALGAADVTMRLLSGLHAHVIVFMACSTPGQRVLLLPERAGGHMSTKAILERLGLLVVEMAVDDQNMRVDVEGTIARARIERPDFVFVDRSEGLTYEDFTELVGVVGVPALFDSSQYLTNVLARDFTSPFAMGFDYIVSTLHKNFPGPQKALLACRATDEQWTQILNRVSTYVSNMHSYDTYAAGFTLDRTAWLKNYSRMMLDNAVLLEEHLAARGVAVVRRSHGPAPTHHVWVACASRETAFAFFKALERCRILVNFRKLPYGLGFGLRLGLNAATRIGLNMSDIAGLADIIAAIHEEGATASNRTHAREFNEAIWARCDDGA